MSQNGTTDEAYDFVIVGAGSAGCVLANRLSADPSNRVLLLEAGGWDNHPLIKLPIGCQDMTRKEMFRFADHSEPDPGLRGRTNYIPHGKVIGGGSSVNYMAHTRCHPADYDGWARNGARGWSFEEVFPYFKQIERWLDGNYAWRGDTGEIGVQFGSTNDPVYRAWTEACSALGYRINPDQNGETPEGMGVLQYSIRGGQRSSSAREFLHPVLNRPNLVVKTDAFVTKVNFNWTEATGVNYVQGEKTFTVRAKKTVLSLGAINTPHLLMLSGIGPAEHLQSKGIKVVADLPVGKNLQDHLAYSVMWNRKDSGSLQKALRLDRALINMVRAMMFHSGPSAQLPAAILGFVRSQNDLPQPDLQLLIQVPSPDAYVWVPGLMKKYQDTLHIRVQLMLPESRGEILLKTANPNDRPSVFYNSLSDQRDVTALSNGYKKAWAIGTSSKMAPHRGTAVCPDKPLIDDGEIENYIRDTASQQYHPAGTCKMGSDDSAVVDSSLHVRGLQNLSVVDASVMPRIISGNPNIPIMMIAAKVADDWKRRSN